MCCKEKIKNRGDTVKNVFVAISFLVTLLAIGCCALIIYYSDAGYQSYQQLQCSAGRIPYDLLAGNQADEWMGLEPAQASVQSINTFMNSDYARITDQLWTGQEWLGTANKDFGSALDKYLSDFEGATVNSPNPESASPIDTSFAANMGPINDVTSFAGSIEADYQIGIEPILLLMQEIFLGSEYGVKNIGEITSQLTSASENLGTFISGNTKVNSNINSWIVDNQSSVKDYWRGFSLGVVLWGWFICVGALITVSAQALNKPSLARGLCCFWIATGVFALIGFALSAAILAAGIVTDNSCGLLDDLFTETGLAKYNIIIPEDIVPYMNVCLNGNGDLQEVLNIATALYYVSNLTGYETSLQGYTITPALANLKSFQYNQANITASMDYADIPASGTAIEDTPDYNLNMLNSLTDNYTTDNFQNTCTTNFASDLWVLAISQCPEDYTYLPATAPTGVPWGEGVPNCEGMD